MKFKVNFPGDIFGGVTAAVIMLPMALAFGVASGLGRLLDSMAPSRSDFLQLYLVELRRRSQAPPDQ